MALLCLIAAAASAAVLVEPVRSDATAVRHPAAFVSFVNDTASPVDTDAGGSVTVRLRVVDASTKRPAAGQVWLRDPYGRRVSGTVALGPTGAATVSSPPPPGSVPGRTVYTLVYGGSRSVLSSTRAFAFRVAMPAHVDTPVMSWAADPDVTNEDVGDVSGLPGYTGRYGNSWNQTTEDSVNWVYDTIASYHPDAFLVTGDLVEGRWGLQGNGSGVFGSNESVASRVQMVRRMAVFYHHQNVVRLKAAGLFDNMYPAIGDHDLGDNNWDDKYSYQTFKRQHLYLWRNAFTNAYYHRSDGTAKFFSRPANVSQFSTTAYAAMLNPQVMLVSLDAFDRVGDTVKEEVVGEQLAWLSKTLATARSKGVRWIIVQAHPPILNAAIWHSSGLHIEGGAQSQLWKVLVRYHVNVYLAGEVHTTSRRTADGVTQLVTGSPVEAGQSAFVTVNVFNDRMDVTLHKWNVGPDGTGARLWQGGCPVSVVQADPTYAGHPGCVFSRADAGDRAYAGIEPTDAGQLTVYLDGRASRGSGLLTQYTKATTWGECAASCRLALGDGDPGTVDQYLSAFGPD